MRRHWGPSRRRYNMNDAVRPPDRVQHDTDLRTSASTIAKPRTGSMSDRARAETLDRLMHAWQARFTDSISPTALRLAFLDWAMHLANAPGSQLRLLETAARSWWTLSSYL